MEISPRSTSMVESLLHLPRHNYEKEAESYDGYKSYEFRGVLTGRAIISISRISS